MVNPEMIRMARDARGVTQTQLCKAIGITQGALSKVEADLMPFPNDRVPELCKALKYPPHFFAEHWTYESAPARLYRKRKSVTQSALTQKGAQMNVLKHQVGRLFRNIEPIERKFPKIEPANTINGPVGVARQVRESLRIPSGPIRNLCDLLEKNGVLIIPFHFGIRQIDACADWIESQPVIFLGDHLCPSRQRFTLAHEFAHLVMHDRWEDTSDEEADLFAGEFLMPRNEIKSQLVPLALKRYMQLKMYWKVSVAALLKQAEIVGVGSAYQRRQMWQILSARGFRLSEPGEDLLPLEQPELLNQLIVLHQNHLEYSSEQLAKLLCINVDELDDTFIRSRKIVSFRSVS